MRRFTGACELLGAVDVAPMVEWITAIPFEAWPQQNKPGAELKPAMVTDLAWNGFGAASDPIVAAAMEHFPDCRAYQRMLSVVMPGHAIAPHRDEQAAYWLCRVHAPLVSNAHSKFVVAGGSMCCCQVLPTG